MLVIRADGNAEIGVGHIMRCLTIAEAWAKEKRMGADGKLQSCPGGKDIPLLFVCADERSACIVREKGFEAVSLGTDYRDMESEFPEWEKIMRLLPENENVILVDSYQVTERYLQELKKYGKVFLMDDMQQHAFPVDGVINYNIFADKEVYESMYAGQKTELYIGSAYTPVRKDFLNRGYEITDSVTDILITTGGGDRDNIAGAVLNAIYDASDEKMNYHLVTGVFNPYFEELKSWENSRRGIHIYHNVQDMAGLMEKCQLAITAGGTTIYELASIGVPFVCFSYAENQEAPTKYIGEKQIAGYAGEYHRKPDQVLDNMKILIALLCSSRAMREAYFRAETSMIDGQGAVRLAKVLRRQ